MLLDKDKYLAIVNSSGWPINKRLTINSRAEFLEGLIHQELIVKRERMITAFGQGLEHLGVLSLIRSNWKTLKSVLVYDPKMQLSAEIFIHQIGSKPPPVDSERELQTYKWFLEYVKCRDAEGIL